MRVAINVIINARPLGTGGREPPITSLLLLNREWSHDFLRKRRAKQDVELARSRLRKSTGSCDRLLNIRPVHYRCKDRIFFRISSFSAPDNRAVITTDRRIALAETSQLVERRTHDSFQIKIPISCRALYRSVSDDYQHEHSVCIEVVSIAGRKPRERAQWNTRQFARLQLECPPRTMTRVRGSRNSTSRQLNDNYNFN